MHSSRNGSGKGSRSEGELILYKARYLRSWGRGKNDTNRPTCFGLRITAMRNKSSGREAVLLTVAVVHVVRVVVVIAGTTSSCINVSI